MRRIYLDHAATTPLLPEVSAAMEPWLTGEFGNPSSLYAEGRRARQAIDEAREVLSKYVGCLFAEVLFTSSGTEAANLAIVGAALANEDPSRNRILFGAAEHHCVLHTQPLLERLGYRVELIAVDRTARTNVDELGRMMNSDVFLVSVMHANNELGTIQPIEEIGAIVHEHGALYHCDAVQTFAYPSLNPIATSAATPDLMNFSAHKVHGPKGAGAIYIKAGTKVKPLALGGGQEREMRAGTENVAAIVGFGAAVAAIHPPPAEGASPRDLFHERLTAAGFLPTVSTKDNILPSHAHFRLPGVEAETMLIRLDRMAISASSGAACSSGSLEASHVLLACGYSEKEAKEGLRFTFGWLSTIEEAEQASHRVIEAAKAISAS